jgi:hypothetical protein
MVGGFRCFKTFVIFLFSLNFNAADSSEGRKTFTERHDFADQIRWKKPPYKFNTGHYNRRLKETNQHNAQLNIHSCTSLHLHVSVSVDQIQGACSYRMHQLNMCLRPRYNDSQILEVSTCCLS